MCKCHFKVTRGKQPFKLKQPLFSERAKQFRNIFKRYKI